MSISITLAKIAGSGIRGTRWSGGHQPKLIKKSDGFIRMLEFQQSLGHDSLEAIEHERSPAYTEKVNEIYRQQNKKVTLSGKIQGKVPFQYFLVPSSGRKEAVLQHWMRYHADSFEEPDTGYSLHTSLEALTKFYAKEGKIAGGLRKILPYHNPALAKPKAVYLTRSTYDLLARKSKGTAGIVITTYLS